MIPPIPPIQDVNLAIEKNGGIQKEVNPDNALHVVETHSLDHQEPQLIQQPYYPNADNPSKDSSGNIKTINGKSDIEVQSIDGDTDKVNTSDNIIRALTQCCRLDIKDVNESRRKQNAKESAPLYILSSGLNCSQIIIAIIGFVGVLIGIVLSFVGIVQAIMVLTSNSIYNDSTMYTSILVGFIVIVIPLVCIGCCLCCFCCGSCGGSFGNCLANESFRSEKLTSSISTAIGALFGCNLGCVGVSSICMCCLLIPIFVGSIVISTYSFGVWSVIPIFFFLVCVICCFSVPCCGVTLTNMIKYFKMKNSLQSSHSCSSEVKLQHDIHSTKKINAFSGAYSTIKVIGGILFFISNIILVSIFVPIYISREVYYYTTYSSYYWNFERIIELVLVIGTILTLGIGFLLFLISHFTDCCGCGILFFLDRKSHKTSGLSAIPNLCSVILQVTSVVIFGTFEFIFVGWSVVNTIISFFGTSNMYSNSSLETTVTVIGFSIAGGVIIYSIEFLLIVLFVVPSWAFSCSTSVRSLLICFFNVDQNKKEIFLEETTTSVEM